MSIKVNPETERLINAAKDLENYFDDVCDVISEMYGPLTSEPLLAEFSRKYSELKDEHDKLWLNVMNSNLAVKGEL